MEQRPNFPGFTTQQSPHFNPHPLSSPYPLGHPFPTVPPAPAMYPGIVRPPPPGPPVSPGPQMPPGPGMLPSFQMPPMPLNDQMHPGAVGPHVAQGLTMQPAPSMAPVSPETGFFAAPYSPSVYSGFGVSPSFQDPPSLPGSRKLPSLPRPRRSAHIPEPYNPEKRQRIVYTHWQKKLLEAAFEKNQYPSHGDCVSLAERADITQPQIKIWCKNHRAKMSKLQLQQHSEEGPWVSRQGACAAVARARPSCLGSNAPAPVPASADAGCPGPSGVSFPTPPHSSSSMDRDSGGHSASDQHSVWDEQVPGRAKDGPVPPAPAGGALPAARPCRAGAAGAPGTSPSPAPDATPDAEASVGTSWCLRAVLPTCQEEGPGPADAGGARAAPAADDQAAPEQLWEELMEDLDMPRDTDLTKAFPPQDIF